MDDRLELHEILCELLGSRNVYFQSPESIKLQYPCIIYSLSNIDSRHANNKIYKTMNRYEVTVIDRDPDSELPYKLLNHFQMCRYDRSYIADNLNHTALSLHY